MKGNTTMNISQEQIASYIRDNIDQCLEFLDADFDFTRRSKNKNRLRRFNGLYRKKKDR